MKDEKTVLVNIPFSGFYNSVHDYHLDQALDGYILSDSSGEVFEGLKEHKLYDYAVDWDKAKKEYVEGFISAFGYEIGLGESCFELDTLDSPREYNFTTDRIFAYMSEADLKDTFDKVMSEAKEKMRDIIKDKFTSCIGFISYYPNELDEWLRTPLEEWDHNQVGTLLEALFWLNSNSIDFDEWELYAVEESYCCLDGALTKDGERLANIAYYLRTREERAFR